MPTALDIVTGALKLLEIKPDESSITASEAEDGLTALNDMMNEWNVDGINIGYESLDDTESELYVNLGAVGAMKANLAVYIAPEYGRVVTDALFERAKRSKKALRSSIPLNPAEYPDSLPVGSGNEGSSYTSNGDSPGGLADSRFYPPNSTDRCS